jgi:hypothetical protein
MFNSNIARFSFDIAGDNISLLARADPNRFGQNTADGSNIAATSPFNTSEESSGIINASSILGPGWFLLDVQAHYTSGGLTSEMIECGQLLAMFVPASVPEPSGALLLMTVGVFGLNRRRRD